MPLVVDTFLLKLGVSGKSILGIFAKGKLPLHYISNLPLGVTNEGREAINMTKTHLRSITNSGTWMLILAPTYSTKIFFGMLLTRDSIVSITIPSSISLLASLFTRSVIHHPATNSLVAMLARLIVMFVTESA